mgnify:CR=1 FL=1
MMTQDNFDWSDLSGISSDSIRAKMAQCRASARKLNIELADDGWPIIPDRAPGRIPARAIESTLNKLDAELMRRNSN